MAGVFTPLADLVQLLGALAVIGLGTWLLARGELTLGALLAFLAYLARLASPVRQLGRLGPALFEASAGAERVLELLDERPAVTDGEHARPLRRVHGRLELRGVHVRYGAAPEPLATAGAPRTRRPTSRRARRPAPYRPRRPISRRARRPAPYRA